ncbi:hypothetical protein [Cohnella sp. REN36]|uniref:hypothetical protein n=1 Tax=Cohnella sp. REN36 TaxID=2887347 RepID=UPI001D14D252|nr:hypothetical protein [Cohnella sp. REN36]MCC3374851.1 hypothetical protein [Cohnella sp. REN36]
MRPLLFGTFILLFELFVFASRILIRFFGHPMETVWLILFLALLAGTSILIVKWLAKKPKSRLFVLIYLASTFVALWYSNHIAIHHVLFTM